MRFYAFFIAAHLLLASITYMYLYLTCSWSRTKPFLLLYVLFTLNMGLSRILSPSCPAFVVKASAWLSGLGLAFTYYVFLLTLLHLGIYLLSKILGFSWHQGRFAQAALGCLLLLLAWGTWRAFHPTLRTESIASTKLVSPSHYRIIMLSDLHLGRILGRSYAETLVERVNAQQPDLIIIAGDILDERRNYLEQENSLEALAGLKARCGTYVAFGNHDYLDRPQLWQEQLEKANLHVLRDSEVIIDGKLKITGLNDWSRNRNNGLPAALGTNNASYYSILVDHQPRRMEAAAQAGYDLYLSGHTHTGQLFPNRLITRHMYALDYGITTCGQLTAITSSGYGFWGPPVRTEAPPELILIELHNS